MATNDMCWASFVLVVAKPFGQKEFVELGETWLNRVPQVGDYLDLRHTPEEDLIPYKVHEVWWEVPHRADHGFDYTEFQSVRIYVHISET